MDAALLNSVSSERLKSDLFAFCREPFSFRTVLYTLPWHKKCSLLEVDDFIAAEMRKYTDRVTLLPNKVQPFRCDSSKPLHHWYSSPLPDDPWYDANNIEVVLPGTDKADEIIQLISHKDSMSWINSPGAQDNAVGAVANMELIRVLSALPRHRTIRVLFCNEEHSPWHSLTYANAARDRNENIIAVMNQDSLCGKAEALDRAGISTQAVVYNFDEGKCLADFMAAENEKYGLPLKVSVAHKKSVNDDDGNFIKAGYLYTVMNLGSYPYEDEQYHLPGDIPERVSIENLKLSTQLIMASVLDIDAAGAEIFKR
ncbi:MAG: M28 family peptidase [Victivallales bacterium]|nr:M28 family peptidase [Victivallales bacterium]